MTDGSDAAFACWSERLARAAAPDEIDIAPDVAAAYASGGSARSRLFAPARADPGAFGAGSVVVLPYLIDALSQCYTIAQRFLGDPAVNSLIGSGSLLIALRQWQVGRRSDAAESPSPPASEESATPPPAATGVLDAVSAHLRRQGFDDEWAEELAVTVVGVLGVDPAGAITFLSALGEQRR